METPAKHVLRKLTKRDGDTVVAEWDPAVETEVEKARDAFNELAGGGFMIFNATDVMKPEGPVRTFDPTVKEYVISPRFVGG